MSTRKIHKACARKDLYVVSTKKYGYHDRYCGFALFTVGNSNPDASVTKLLECSGNLCNRVESSPGEFKYCTMCLTIYCTTECQKSDWSNHKSFCKSDKAYYSQLSKWQTTLPPSVLDDCLFNGKEYLNAWEKWMISDKMQKLLKFINKSKEDFKPY
jgi:hypothetical protein